MLVIYVPVALPVNAVYSIYGSYNLIIKLDITGLKPHISRIYEALSCVSDLYLFTMITHHGKQLDQSEPISGTYDI